MREKKTKTKEQREAHNRLENKRRKEERGIVSQILNHQEEKRNSGTRQEGRFRVTLKDR